MMPPLIRVIATSCPNGGSRHFCASSALKLEKCLLLQIKLICRAPAPCLILEQGAMTHNLC